MSRREIYQHGGAFPVFKGHYQYGDGFRVFRGPYQRGDGIGSFFSGLWRTLRPLVVPMAKKAAKAVGKQALASGSQFATDVLAGESVKQSVKQRFNEGTRSLRGKFDNAIERMSQSGAGKRKRRAGKCQRGAGKRQRGAGKKRKVRKRKAGGNKRKLAAPMIASQVLRLQRKRRAPASRKIPKDIFHHGFNP